MQAFDFKKQYFTSRLTSDVFLTGRLSSVLCRQRGKDRFDWDRRPTAGLHLAVCGVGQRHHSNYRHHRVVRSHFRRHTRQRERSAAPPGRARSHRHRHPRKDPRVSVSVSMSVSWNAVLTELQCTGEWLLSSPVQSSSVLSRLRWSWASVGTPKALPLYKDMIGAQKINMDHTILTSPL